jgi:hypothetical protein
MKKTGGRRKMFITWANAANWVNCPAPFQVPASVPNLCLTTDTLAAYKRYFFENAKKSIACCFAYLFTPFGSE